MKINKQTKNISAFYHFLFPFHQKTPQNVAEKEQIFFSESMNNTKGLWEDAFVHGKGNKINKVWNRIYTDAPDFFTTTDTNSDSV